MKNKKKFLRTSISALVVVATVLIAVVATIKYKEDYDEAIKWAEDTIKLIENETEFLCNPDAYYCWNLCSQRNNACQYKPQLTSKKNKENNRRYNPETDSYE